MRDWIECTTCGEEYKVISAAHKEDEAVYCPFCGSEGEYGWPEGDEEEED